MPKKKKTNHLSVWTFPYRKSYYLTHPWKWFKDLYWNVRNFIHRGRYGFAYVDAWNWYYWWPRVGAMALRHIAEYGHGYPDCEPFETPEKWHRYLRELADRLDWASDDGDFFSTAHDRLNEYYEEMEKARAKLRVARKDGFTEEYKAPPTPEEQEAFDQLQKKYWDREAELDEEDTQKRIVLFSEIGKRLPRFWD